MLSESAEIKAPADIEQDRPAAPRKSTFSLEPAKLPTYLLAVSAAQLVLALLMYLVPSTSALLLTIEGAFAVALILYARYRPMTKKAARVLLRVLYIFGMAAAVAGSLIIEGIMASETTSLSEPVFQSYSWMVLAMVLIPPMLFLQPVLAFTARYRRRFDLVLLRILAIFTLLLSLALCLFALEYDVNGRGILTSSVYAFTLLGHSFSFTLAVNCIFTRVLFCACSAAMVFLSFRLHPEKANKSTPST